MVVDNPSNQSPPNMPMPVPPAPVPKRTSWPVLFGVGAIFFGAIGVMGSLPAGCAGGMVSALLPAGSADQAGADSVRGMTFWFGLGSLVSAALSVLLLAVGIGLCQRRAWSIRLTWIWSVLNLGITVVATVGTYILSRQFLASMQAHSRDLMISISHDDVARISLALAVAVLVVGWANPVFLLIWLARPSIRSEIAQWS